MPLSLTPQENIGTSRADVLGAAFKELAQDWRIWNQGLDYAFKRLTETAGRALAVERTSVWLLSDDRSELHCCDLFLALPHEHRQCDSLAASAYPVYFSALADNRVIDACNALTDQRTQEFHHGYLERHGIGALLGATLRQAGVVQGVLCFERVGSAREWTKDEQEFAVSAADLIAQLLILHELRESESRYRTLVNNMPSAAYRRLLDEHWTVEFISNGIQSMTGYPPEAFTHNRAVRFVDLIHPEDRAIVKQTVMANVAADHPSTLEYRILHRDGGIRWVQESSRAVRDATGKVVYLDGAISDITESKQAAEERLRLERLIAHISQGIAGNIGEQFFQRLVEQLTRALDMDFALVAEYKPEPQHTLASIAMYGDDRLQPNFSVPMAGTPCEWVMQRGTLCFPSGVQAAFPNDAFLKAMAAEAYLGTPLYDAHGQPLGVLVVISRSPIPDPAIAEQIIHIFAVRAASELERRRAEIALKASEERYRALFASAGDAIFIMEQDRFIDCNPKTLEMFGCRREDIIGQPPYRFSPPHQQDGRDSTEKALEKIGAAFAGQPQYFEWRHIRLDGTPFDAEVSLTRVELAGRQHLLAMVRDITARKQTESALQRSKHELETRNSTLQVVNELADRLHRSLDVQTLAEEAIRVLQGHSRPPMSAFYLLDEGRQQLRLIASHGFSQELLQATATLPLEGCLSGLALQKAQMIHCEDIAADNRLKPAVKTALLQEGIRSAIALPLIFMGKPFGALNLAYTDHHPFTTQELETYRSVGHTISLAISNAMHMQQMERQALHDTLTGLANRALLHQEAARVIEASAELKHQAALLLIDLDRFKEINDTLGHHTGDELLKQVGPRLRQALASEGTLVSRLGGDEFAVLVDKVNGPAEGTRIALRMLEALRRPFLINNVSLEIGGSVGLALYPQHGQDSHALLRCADVAMYHAKEKSAGFMLYEPGFDEQTPLRLAMMTDLGAAIRDDELLLHYQPKVDLCTGRITGCEALVRWSHRRLGMVAPDRFIPLAEMGDLIGPITLWVIRKALQQVLAWQAQGMDVPVAVNLSARSLLNRTCPNKIAELIAEYGVAPHLLELEITESALISDPERAVEILDRLGGLGIRLSVDDFGTGYSSLAYLKRLPIQSLKIDRSFVSEMLKDEQDAIIVRSTIALAHSLGLHVIGEGVEDKITMATLRGMGCDQAQGFHIARPQTAEAITHWFKDYSGYTSS